MPILAKFEEIGLSCAHRSLIGVHTNWWTLTAWNYLSLLYRQLTQFFGLVSYGSAQQVHDDDANDEVLPQGDCDDRSWALFLALLSVLRVKFDILCFSESWLTDATKQLIIFQGYQSFPSLRPINKRGGGISIFMKDSIR